MEDQKAFFRNDSKDPLTAESELLLSREGWTIHYADSAADNRPASNVLDGDSETHWNTQWKKPNRPNHPHDIQIDLGKPQTFGGLQYTPKKGNWATVGRLRDFQVFVSNDGKSWGVPLVKGSFKNRDETQSVIFKETTARFVRLVSLSAYRDVRQVSMAELNLLSPKPDRLDSEPKIFTPNNSKEKRGSFFESRE